MVQTWWPVEASPKLLAVEEVVKCKWWRSRFGRGKRNIFINLGLLFTLHILKGIQVRSLLLIPVASSQYITPSTCFIVGMVSFGLCTSLSFFFFLNISSVSLAKELQFSLINQRMHFQYAEFFSRLSLLYLFEGVPSAEVEIVLVYNLVVYSCAGSSVCLV